MDGVSSGLVVLFSRSRELGSLGLRGDRSAAIVAMRTLPNGSCRMTSAHFKEFVMIAATLESLAAELGR
jgi:hypothetical protein